ncbi:uncharacterized protein AMSG_04599 [Thecamonas trahens ATCC 50062]|uniref:Uncharacterized protein n=1 Tax=Thecamonas trahens ATCC 50062 TaxID=461836 RepID=A0A0L0D934_THETB|nr:hypothetical protein AMSG_04599 [Thecamonas trahens ATCC 50062]KNC48854.1 hypothetical protein AMSG_04599 [Thecamonas trahens ATCC 50062]|eukprot:XP_013758274.1 hypothetical protein AMSG_04599 [Thecamonas trahens ATCC 50062]
MAAVVQANAPPPPPSLSPVTEDSKVYLGTWIGLMAAVVFVGLLALFVLWNGCCRIIPKRVEVKKRKEEEEVLIRRRHAPHPAPWRRTGASLHRY